MDAASRFDCRSGLWRAAMMGFCVLGKVPKAQHSRRCGDDQKHHHRGNPKFDSVRHQNKLTLIHVWRTKLWFVSRSGLGSPMRVSREVGSRMTGYPEISIADDRWCFDHDETTMGSENGCEPRQIRHKQEGAPNSHVYWRYCICGFAISGLQIKQKRPFTAITRVRIPSGTPTK
jgi:hypothetical protein